MVLEPDRRASSRPGRGLTTVKGACWRVWPRLKDDLAGTQVIGG